MKRLLAKGDFCFLLVFLIAGISIIMVRTTIFSVFMSLCGIALAYVLVVIWRLRNADLLALSIEYLKRGSLGDYKILEEALQVGRYLADKVKDIKDKNPDRNLVLELHKKTFEQHKNFYGLSILWEPNAFDGKDLEWADSKSPKGFKDKFHDQRGRFVSYFYRDNGKAMLIALENIDNEDWYSIPKKSMQVAILDPFHYEIENRKVLMTTVAVPIIIRGKFFGIIGVDIELNDIEKIQKDVVMFESKYKNTDIEEIKKLLLKKGGYFKVLGEAIKAANNNQKSILNNLLDTADQVAGTAENLKIITNQSSQAMEEIAKAVEEIAESANEQARDTENGAASIRQLGEITEKDQNNLFELNKAIEIVEKMKQEGSSAIVELIARTQEREEYNKLLMDGILKTHESTQKINSASQVIQSMADQTNLLALNAAIEAAHAGDQGRGFAVVAEEIRKLAEQSGDSAKEIEQVVNELQQKSKESVEIMDKSVATAEKQEKSVRITEERFIHIASATQKTKDIIAELNLCGQEMKKRNDEVREIIRKLSAIAEENAAGTQQMLASSEEQTATVTEIADASKKLLEMSNNLKTAISKFK